MIEYLVDYIVKKGFEVRVEKGRIIISKQVSKGFVQYGWAIDPYELSALIPKDVFFDRADYYMDLINQAIEKGPPVDERRTECPHL